MYEQLMLMLKRYYSLQSALSLFYFDMDTNAAEGSIQRSAEVTNQLSAMALELLKSDSLKETLQLAKQEPLDATQKRMIAIVEKQLKQLEAIPNALYLENEALCTKAQWAWEDAKTKDDYDLFKPYLKQIIEKSKQMAQLKREPGQSLYDVLLDDYEEGMDEKSYDDFFELIKKELVPVIKKVNARKKPRPHFMDERYDVDKQKQFNHELASYEGFDFKRGMMKETEHPYTTNLHKDDVRLTNHYYEDNFTSALFSTIHEAGHGIYEQNIADAFTMSPAVHISSGMHESQSRFMENCIGRSEAFWKPLYPRLQSYFEAQLKDVSLDEFIDAINLSECSCIRTEADELTYPLHILIRYELEKQMINGDVDIEKLPSMWNAMYKQYLGVDVPSCREGILQDVHWSGGSFGYFPTYALGSAIACQLYAYLKKTEPLEVWLEEEDLSKLCAWLKENVQSFGCLKTTNEMLREVTGEPFNPRYYIDYLKEKAAKMYKIQDI